MMSKLNPLFNKIKMDGINSKTEQNKKSKILKIGGIVLVVFLILFLIGTFFSDEETICQPLKNGYYTCSEILEEKYDNHNNLTNYRFIDEQGKENEYKFEYKYDKDGKVTYIKEYENSKSLGFAKAKYYDGYIKQLNYNDTITYDYYYDEERFDEKYRVKEEDKKIYKVVLSTKNSDNTRSIYFGSDGYALVQKNWQYQLTYNPDEEKIEDMYMYFGGEMKEYNNAFELFGFLPMDLWLGELNNPKSSTFIMMSPTINAPSVLATKGDGFYRKNNAGETLVYYTNDYKNLSYIKSGNSITHYKYYHKGSDERVYILYDLGKNGCTGLEKCDRYTEIMLKVKDEKYIKTTTVLSKEQYERKLKEYEKIQTSGDDDGGYEYNLNHRLEKVQNDEIADFPKKYRKMFLNDYETIIDGEQFNAYGGNSEMPTDKSNKFITYSGYKLETIKTKELIKKMKENKQELILFVNHGNNGVDMMYLILKQINQKYNIPISFYNLDDMTNEEEQTIFSMLEPENWREEYDHIPVLVAELGGKHGAAYFPIHNEWTYKTYVDHLIANEFMSADS